MPSRLHIDLTQEQKRRAMDLGIDLDAPARIRYRAGRVVAVNGISFEERPPELHFVQPDYPDYESPIDGRIVHGRTGRRDDLRRHGCRPYEGREAEQREANRWHAEQDRKLDQLAEKIAHSGWAEAPERIRRVFRGK